MSVAGQPGKNMSDPAGLAGRGRARKGQLAIARVATLVAALGLLTGAATAAPAAPATATITAADGGLGAMIARDHARRINLWTSKALKCASCSNATLGRFPGGINVGSPYARGTTGRNLDGGDDGSLCLGTTEGKLRLSSDGSLALAAPGSGQGLVTLQNAGSEGDTWCLFTTDGGTTWRVKSRYWSARRGNTQELSIPCGASGSESFDVEHEGNNGVCQRFTLASASEAGG